MTEARQIPLTNGGFALVDAADFDWLTEYTWYHSERGYALQSSKRPGKNSGAAMHRVIMNPPKGTVADHVNGDRLDNRRCNLRIVDYLQNAQNRGKNVNSRSKYKGVCWKVENHKWQARIRVNGKQHHIGLYQTEEDAARAYNAAAIMNHGDYSRLNIIPGDPAPCKPDECPVCHLRTTEPVMSNVEAVGTAQALMEGKAEKIDIAKPDESCAASDQPDDCRAAFVKWCWPELSGPDDVALITIFDGESYIEPFGTAWKAWQACWHSRPVRESRRDADIAIPISGWQPIVTAPKDGTVVLFYGNDGIGSIIQAQWQVNEADYVTGFYDANGFRGLVSGTHWMHLPESPTTRIEGQEGK